MYWFPSQIHRVIKDKDQLNACKEVGGCPESARVDGAHPTAFASGKGGATTGPGRGFPPTHPSVPHPEPLAAVCAPRLQVILQHYASILAMFKTYSTHGTISDVFNMQWNDFTDMAQDMQVWPRC
jgi:hypothetical protein